MTDSVKNWWLDMTEHELVNHLTNKLRYPPPLVAKITERVKEAREARRTARIRDAQVKKQWAKVIDPARAELRTIRVIKNQTAKTEPIDEAKWNALCQYEGVVSMTIKRMRGAMRDEDGRAVTPTQYLALRRTKGKKFIPPNNGEHWTDWVTPTERATIMDLFKQVKQPKRGAGKEPFARRVPRKVYLEQRRALITKLQADLAHAEQEYDMATEPEERDRLNDLIQRMHRATKLYFDLKPRTPVPSSWQALLEKA